MLSACARLGPSPAMPAFLAVESRRGAVAWGPTGTNTPIVVVMHCDRNPEEAADLRQRLLPLLLRPLRPLPQHELLDLPRARLRHLREHHVARHLVGGEVGATVGDDVLHGRGRRA